MKPKDLLSPYPWEERHVVLRDRILFIPEYYDYTLYTFPPWNDEEVFANDNPVKIEYCSGNGSWILDRALEDPMTNWVAVEKRFDRVRKLWSKRENRGVKNLFIVCGEAQPFARFYVPDATVSGIYVNFPDPWPKERHAKHRIIQSPFVSDCARSLMRGASLVLVTDDETYCGQMVEVLSNEKALSPFYPSPYYSRDIEGHGASFFHDLWKGMGRTINHITFTKQ